MTLALLPQQDKDSSRAGQRHFSPINFVLSYTRPNGEGGADVTFPENPCSSYGGLARSFRKQWRRALGWRIRDAVLRVRRKKAACRAIDQLTRSPARSNPPPSVLKHVALGTGRTSVASPTWPAFRQATTMSRTVLDRCQPVSSFERVRAHTVAECTHSTRHLFLLDVALPRGPPVGGVGELIVIFYEQPITP